MCLRCQYSNLRTSHVLVSPEEKKAHVGGLKGNNDFLYTHFLSHRLCGGLIKERLSSVLLS